MGALVPSLGGGWITDPPRQLNTMLAHALVSDYSQSTIYLGQVTSIAYIVALYQNNQSDMADALETALQTYFGRVFPNVTVQVTYGAPVNNVYDLYLSVNAVVNGNTYQLSRSVLVDNGTLKLVVKALNA